jgi:hypothetical protein
VGSAWKILPVTARSLWSVLGGGGRESPVKHGAGGASTGGGWAGKDRARGASTGGGGGTGEEGPGGGSSMGALCTGFTLVNIIESTIWKLLHMHWTFESFVKIENNNKNHGEMVNKRNQLLIEI